MNRSLEILLTVALPLLMALFASEPPGVLGQIAPALSPNAVRPVLE